MKRCAKIPLLFSVLLFGFCFIGAGRVMAQKFTVLHTFTGGVDGFTNGIDGAYPFGRLTLSGKTLYGTTAQGGIAGVGTVFSLNSDGTAYTVLHSFAGGNEGGDPSAGLAISNNTLYGSAFGGGTSGSGIIFKVNTDGMGFTNLYNFTAVSGPYPYSNSDGAGPHSDLLLVGDTLYGMTISGGGGGTGTILSLGADGSDFRSIHSFGLIPDLTPPYSNGDGGRPWGWLVASGKTIYGTAQLGGAFGYGTIFSVNTDGTAFVVLHNFAGVDGANPLAGLVLSGSTIYGTTSTGAGNGTVFRINTNGTGFTILHNFNGKDGTQPNGGLAQSGNVLYGTTGLGGGFNNGTIFQVNADGTGFSNLYNFAASNPDPNTDPAGLSTNLDGAYPYPGLVLDGNSLYGVAFIGGSSGKGTVFRLSLLPQLTITTAGTNLILVWPTNFVGFMLQSTTTLTAPGWTTNSPPPVIINGQYTVTNPISDGQQFFRLSQP